MTTLTLDRYAGHAFSYDVTDLGFNYRMDELRAAVGRAQLTKLRERNGHRSMLLERYRARFDGDASGVSLPFERGEATVAHLCPALLPEGTDRGRVMRMLREAGIHTSIHYPPIHRFSYHAERLGPQQLPHTEAFAARELSLPLHPGVTVEDVDSVVDRLHTALP
jgi:dTDP-4-amino-4,6-dideoxygalactose transaminase